MRKFTVWNTLLFQTNLGIKRIKDCTKKSSLEFWIFTASVEESVLTVQTVLLNLLQLVIQTLFIRNQPTQPLLRLLLDTKKERDHKIFSISLKNSCTGQLKTDILLCMCIDKNKKNNKISIV